MTIKPKRQSIREAASPGPKIHHGEQRPEEPVDRGGNPTLAKPTYEELARYRDLAQAKLKGYKTLVESVYQILENREPEEGIVEAKRVIHEFDRSLPPLRPPVPVSESAEDGEP